MDSLTKLLVAIRDREPGRWGIRTAKDYLDGIDSCMCDGHCAITASKLATADQWEKAVKEAAGKLVYSDDETSILAKSSFALNPTPKAALDFACVLTSTREDRDGDVLESGGADLDEKMPLLWQHITFQPVGAMKRLLSKTTQNVQVHYAVADTELGRDGATLIELGALRMSHGFRPVDAEPRKDKNRGWHVKRFMIFEGSIVSVPSNVDGVITAFSRQKLHHPLVKSWAEKQYAERPTMVDVPATYSHTVKVGGVSETVTFANKSELDDHIKRVREDEPEETKGAVAYMATAKADLDMAWDGDSAKTRLAKLAGVDGRDTSDAAWKKFASGFGYVDGDGAAIGDYKLPHHDVKDGKLVVVLQGVAAAMAAINGARGGMKMPEADRKKVYSHLSRHYKQFDQEPPEMKSAGELEAATADVSAKSAAPNVAKVYTPIEGSWEWINDKLRETLSIYLIGKGAIGRNDYARIDSMFPESALVCVSSYENASYKMKCWRLGWTMTDGDPAWDGEPVEVQVVARIEEIEKQLRTLAGRMLEEAPTEKLASLLLKRLVSTGIGPTHADPLLDALTAARDAAAEREESSALAELIGL